MKKGYIYIFLSAFLFSTMEIVLKMNSIIFDPIQITFLRFLIGSIILLPTAAKELKKRRVSLSSNDYAFFALSGFICVALSMVLFNFAVMYANASVVAVLFSCNPVFVVAFAFLLLREKIYPYTIISVVLSLAGIVFIIDPRHGSVSFAGAALTILSAIAFAFYGVLGKKRTAQYGGIALTAWSFLFGSLELFALIMAAKLPFFHAFLSSHGLSGFAEINILANVNLTNLPSLLYISVFVTGLGYTFYFLAMEKTSASTASLVFFIKPALAPILALAILSEPISASMWTGIALIVAGSFISFISAGKKRA